MEEDEWEEKEEESVRRRLGRWKRRGGGEGEGCFL